MNNFHELLTSDSKGCFANAIAVSKSDDEKLRDARDDIRLRIKSSFGKGAELVLKEQALIEKASGLIKPKFRMQGSFSYRTAIERAHTPPQQIDLDDGMFLPVSFVTQGNTVEPNIASHTLFQVVEEALAPLCAEKGWTLVKDKSSCVRLVINARSHIDIALYAVPDSQFANKFEVAGLSAQFMREEAQLRDDIYLKLREDEIRLALRDGSWRRSDPRKLETWFGDAVKRHGDIVRRMSQFVKAWRDFSKDIDALASIALMSAVVESFDKGTLQSDRDDLALLAIAEALPEKVSKAIPNPVVPGETLDQGWTSEQRQHFIASAVLLRTALRSASYEAQWPSEVIKKLQEVFGARMPNLTSSVVCGQAAPETKGQSTPFATPIDANKVSDAVRARIAAGVPVRPYHE